MARRAAIGPFWNATTASSGTLINMDRVKEHFESEAEQFDGIIRRLIPFYEEMVDAAVSALPFSADAPIRVLDLGCGTGTLGLRTL